MFGRETKLYKYGMFFVSGKSFSIEVPINPKKMNRLYNRSAIIDAGKVVFSMGKVESFMLIDGTETNESENVEVA